MMKLLSPVNRFNSFIALFKQITIYNDFLTLKTIHAKCMRVSVSSYDKFLQKTEQSSNFSMKIKYVIIVNP